MFISEFTYGVLATLAVEFILLIGAIILCALNTNDKNNKE